jgi:chorismate mutase/prephenate dehydrogenase
MSDTPRRESDLESLRAEMAAVDREIVERIARRQELAGAIGRLKITAGAPTRDYAQEKTVLARAEAIAREAGVPAELARRIVLDLIEASLTVQERDRIGSAGEGGGRTALVIGGAGRMGRWMAAFLESQGFAVSIADPAVTAETAAHYRDWRGRALDHDVIVVAAPLRTSAGILADMAKAPPPGVVFDVGSLKGPLRDGLVALAAAGGRVTSIHPMFGPSTELLSGRHVIFVDVGAPEATAAAKALFASTMAAQVDMDLESHDRMIAFVLGLSHATNIAFFTALAESGAGAPRLAELSSTTFDAQMRIAQGVAGESPELYFEIQSLNDYGADALAALHEAVERVCTVVAEDDEEGFRRLMVRGREYLESIRRDRI